MVLEKERAGNPAGCGSASRGSLSYKDNRLFYAPFPAADVNPRDQAAICSDCGRFSLSGEGLRTGRKGGSGVGGCDASAGSGSVATSSERRLRITAEKIMLGVYRHWSEWLETVKFPAVIEYAAKRAKVAEICRQSGDVVSTPDDEPQKMQFLRQCKLTL